MTGKIVHQHFPAKSFSVFDYALSIMKENPVYGAHIVAARTSKIAEHVVFDTNRVAACIENPSSDDVVSTAREVMARRLADLDPEIRYTVAADLLFCGQKDAALQLLKSSIAGHFCAYAGLQNDSTWAKLRGTPEFAELLSAAKQCRDKFLAERSQGAH